MRTFSETHIGGWIIYTVFGVFSYSDDVISPRTFAKFTFTNPENYLRLLGGGVRLEAFSFGL